MLGVVAPPTYPVDRDQSQEANQLIGSESKALLPLQLVAHSENEVAGGTSSS